MRPVQRYRDIQLIEKDADTWLAVACDISAGIGDKAMDTVKVAAETAGYYAAVVPFVELLAIGGDIISVADTIGVAMDETGQAIINGVKRAMDELDMPQACLTGSTEDNMPTVTTSIGITAIAELDKSAMNKLSPKPGDYLVVVGLPKMGERFLKEEIMGHKGEVITISTVMSIRKMTGVSHMLPVGSKGILHELKVLEELYGLSVRNLSVGQLDLRASAGPATCMIVACREEAYRTMLTELPIPMTIIGYIE